MIRFELTVKTIAISDDDNSLKSLIDLAKTTDPKELALFLEQNLTDSMVMIIAENLATTSFKIENLTYEFGESNTVSK